ncbi:MAG: hypothetical protein WCC36_13025 [Gammaproteobacteria bacterium]
MTYLHKPEIRPATRSYAGAASLVDARYTVTAVEAVPAHECGDDLWHRYVLETMGSTITGRRRGTLDEVTRYAREFAEQINERYSSAGWTTWMHKPR